jgi:hypothetical protein
MVNNIATEVPVHWRIDGEAAGSRALRRDIRDNLIVIGVPGDREGEATISFHVDGWPAAQGEITGVRSCHPNEAPQWPDEAQRLLDDE